MKTYVDKEIGGIIVEKFKENGSPYVVAILNSKEVMEKEGYRVSLVKKGTSRLLNGDEINCLGFNLESLK